MPYDTVSCSSSVTQVILLVSLISFSMWPISSVVVLLLSTVLTLLFAGLRFLQICGWTENSHICFHRVASHYISTIHSVYVLDKYTRTSIIRTTCTWARMFEIHLAHA